MKRVSFSDVRAALEPLRNPARAAEMSAYVRDQFPFLGIDATTRRTAVRPVLARRPLDWPLVWACWDAPEREYQYVAVDHLRRLKVFPAKQLESLRELIVTKSWWDTVDHLAKVAGTALSDAAFSTSGVASEDARATLRAWAHDENLWVRRVGILCQLSLGTATDTAMLRDAIETNLGSSEFFINKAIGWALRDYYRHNPEWVVEFVEGHELAPLSRREALKHHTTV